MNVKQHGKIENGTGGDPTTQLSRAWIVVGKAPRS